MPKVLSWWSWDSVHSHGEHTQGYVCDVAQDAHFQCEKPLGLTPSISVLIPRRLHQHGTRDARSIPSDKISLIPVRTLNVEAIFVLSSPTLANHLRWSAGKWGVSQIWPGFAFSGGPFSSDQAMMSDGQACCRCHTLSEQMQLQLQIWEGCSYDAPSSFEWWSILYWYSESTMCTWSSRGAKIMSILDVCW